MSPATSVRESVLLTALPSAAAIIAFAGNAVLCRLALGSGSIDAATFSLVRFGAGAAILVLVLWLTDNRRTVLAGTWTSALVLFAYAVPFSYAYLTLSAGTGALLLFGSVQVTMMTTALVSGERPTVVQWLGLAAAFGGLVYLLRPGLTAPPLVGSLLMIGAGVFWGTYSLLGRASVRPLAHTAGNFARVSPLLACAWIADRPHWHVTSSGLAIAALAGTITSALGYVVWYFALRRLSATRASIVQIAVPVLAAVAGVSVMGESMTLRLVLSAAMVLGGVALTLAGRETR
ncbi:MAG: DMT family transporter [Acidobacteriota bacterium]